VVKEVGAGLAGVEVWGWDPFGVSVADLDGPSVFGEAVVGAAGQDFFVDVGLAVVLGPVGVDGGRSVRACAQAISRRRAPEPDVRLSPHPALRRSCWDGARCFQGVRDLRWRIGLGIATSVKRCSRLRVRRRRRGAVSMTAVSNNS
jgi:hypothetical protein